MSVLLGSEVGKERVAREALILLRNNLNDSLVEEDAKWETLDKELAQQLKIPYTKCVSNKVSPNNFYMGHRPSLIESSVDKYPNVAVMTYRGSASQDRGDHYVGYQLTMFIEAMVIDGPYKNNPNFERTGEDLVNRKVQRMEEAIHNVMLSNLTLNGIVDEISSAPNILTTECFRRREETSNGSDFYWQMTRLEYGINKISSAY